MRLGLPSLQLAAALAVAPAWASQGGPGVLVESVDGGRAAQSAGLRSGDRLLSWRRESPSPPPDGAAASGEFRTPFDVDEVAFEQGPRGGVRLRLARDAEVLETTLPPDEWGLAARPVLAEEILADYERARVLVEGEDGAGRDQGLDVWAGLVPRLDARGDAGAALWLSFRTAEAHVRLGHAGPAQAAFEMAFALARRVGPWASARIRTAQARAAFRHDRERSRVLFREALELAEQAAPGSLSTARLYNLLGVCSHYEGDLDAAESYHRRALHIRQRLAPDSSDLSQSLNNLGTAAVAGGRLSEAEHYFRRSLELRRRLAPRGRDVSQSLNNLGAVAQTRGDLSAAEGFLREALALETAREPESMEVAAMVSNLGEILLERGQAEDAMRHFERALAMEEARAPDGMEVAGSLVNLGKASAKLGDLTRARRHLDRALDIGRRRAPWGKETAAAHQELGDLHLRQGERAAARERFAEALSIHAERAPGSSSEAESAHGLARALALAGRTEEALVQLGRALDALDGQADRLGGPDESRAVFMARHARLYRDALDLMLRQGRRDDAFHTLERSRARGLLGLIGERDLLSADLPEELARERRQINTAYDRLLGELSDLTGSGDQERRRTLAAELERLRGRRADVQSRLRAAAPRWATLRLPQPLDVRGARAALDPGTLMLSYAVGPESTLLFALGPDGGELEVHELKVAAAELRLQVNELRRQIVQSRRGGRTAKLRLLARALGRRLLEPVAGRLARAQRLLLIPDGPLHRAPFAALIDPSVPNRDAWLVEGRPLSVAVSITLYAELKRTRPAGDGAARGEVVAFGDPVYPGTGRPAPADAAWQALDRSGQKLGRLPASRREVQELGRSFGSRARLLLGAEATEEAAKAVGESASIVHFACHGLMDDASPLDSALALTVPETAEGRDNGLLQAWEVFEQVRLRADLVTLSACDTAGTREQSGEGLMGLTRAFHTAGARSVLATLWKVGDEASSRLLEGFYRHLSRGRGAAEALRLAQLDLITRRGPEAELSRPFYWAAYQLSGDSR